MRMELVLAELHYPGLQPTLAGFLLVDRKTNSMVWRFLPKWSMIEDKVDREVLAKTDELITSFVSELGVERCLAVLEDQLSNVLRLSNRLAFCSSALDMEACADALASILLSEPEALRRVASARG